MLINFVSNLPPDLRSGGFSAMNAAAFRAVGKGFATHYAGPVDLSPRLGQKLASQARRMAGLAGDYFFYSERQLAAFAADVAARCDPAAGLDFFHGFTPWIAARPARPYVAWSDCTFRDYVRHYNRPAEFRAADLARIERQEAEWLRAARAVGFTSRWAADHAIRDYALDPARVHVVGIFGEAEMPAADAYAASRRFAFVSTDFAAKGGSAVVAAFRALRARHAGASLVIVGDSPAAMVPEPGIVMAGYLRKEDPTENARLHAILATSRAVVHPTKSDIAPLLLVEAGYFGCPAIATRRFAIGEIIEHEVTGLLIDNADDVSAIAEAMAWMLETDESRYLAMRRASWTRAREDFSKARFEDRLVAMIQSALPAMP